MPRPWLGSSSPRVLIYMSPPPLPPHLSDISCNGKTIDLFKRRVVSPNELFFAVFILMTPWKIP
jgi:hypothetical protein